MYVSICYINKFAAGSGSIPDTTYLFIEILSENLLSGICYDIFKCIFMKIKGGDIMTELSIVIICWLCCYGGCGVIGKHCIKT